MDNCNMCRPVFSGGVWDGEIMLLIDLSDANSPQDASEIMARHHSILVDLAQPNAHSDNRMNKIRTMLTSSGEAERMTVKLYQAKVNELLNQIAKLEQKKTAWQRVKEWFRRGK